MREGMVRGDSLNTYEHYLESVEENEIQPVRSDKVSTDDRAFTVYSVFLSEVSLHAGARSFHHGQHIIHGPNISTT